MLLNGYKQETKATCGDETWGTGTVCSAGSTNRKCLKAKLVLSVINAPVSCSSFFEDLKLFNCGDLGTASVHNPFTLLSGFCTGSSPFSGAWDVPWKWRGLYSSPAVAVRCNAVTAIKFLDRVVT